MQRVRLPRCGGCARCWSRCTVRRKLKGELCTRLDCTLGTLAHRTRNTIFGFGTSGRNRVRFVEIRLQIAPGLD